MIRKGTASKHKIVLCIISFAAFALLLTGGLFRSETQSAVPCQIVLFGDSVYGNVRDETAIAAQLEAMTGKAVFNAAIGGTGTGRGDRSNRLDYSDDSLSVVALTKAIYASDFGVQHTMRSRNVITDYFPEMLRGLEKLDFSSVELAIIGSGTNDYFNGTMREDPKELTSEYTFAGALRRSVSYLRKANPDIRILLVTPTYNWLLATGQTCEEYNVGGLLEEYIAVELAVATELGVEVLDLYHGFYPHEKWEDWQIYTFDGVHPNEAGRNLIAERIAAYLLQTL